MQIRRLEKTDLEYANNLRNKYIDLIRQTYPHNMKQQEEWFNTNPLYWVISKENGEKHRFEWSDNLVLKYKDFDIFEPKGIIGLTNIDLVNRKAELSLITEDYLIKEYADFAFNFIEKFAFEKLSLHKLFITVYEFDEKKNEYFSERYTKEFEIKDNVFYKNRFWKENYYSKISEY